MSESKPKLAPRRPVLLIILDGFGSNTSTQHNAVTMAKTPNLDRLFAANPHTLISTSGSAVGLPDGQMGNCEEMVDPVTGEPHTQHTTYPVSCMIIDEQKWKLSSCGGGLLTSRRRYCS